MQNWEASVRLDPTFAIPWRNLGIAYHNVRHDLEQAHACYLRAIENNPHDPRLLSEIDQLFKRMGLEPQERLAYLEQRLDLVEQRDDLFIDRVALYNRLDQPEKALELLSSRHFHPWEGGEGRVSDQYVAAHCMLGRAALDAGDASGALVHFDAARAYPENLGEGKYFQVPDTNLDYFSGLARETLGDAEGARACFQKAADAQVNLVWFGFMAYYQALALRKLGQEEAARTRLQEMLDDAQERMEGGKKAGFYTSLPDFLLFRDDKKTTRINSLYLMGLAHAGLGQTALAREELEEVARLDVNHLWAREELRRLG